MRSPYIIYNCPLDFETSPEKLEELHKLLAKYYKYLGGYARTIRFYDFTTKTYKKVKVFRAVYEQHTDEWSSGGGGYRYYSNTMDVADKYVSEGRGDDSRIRDHERKKPKQVWTKEELQEEKAKKELTKEENVIGRIFTCMHDHTKYPYAQDEAMFFLDCNKGKYKVLIVHYHDNGAYLREDYKFKKEVWEMMEEGEWKENDLGFLVSHGSPKQTMLAKIKEYLAAYNRGMQQLEQVQERGLAELKEEVEKRVKEEDNED